MRMALAAASAALLLAAPSAAQDDNLERRLSKLEKEVRAVQRKVFPGGSERFFEPEITPEPATAASPNVPQATPVTNLITRVDALERQLAELTGQVEENGFKLDRIEERLAAIEVAREAEMSAERAEQAAASASGEEAEAETGTVTESEGESEGAADSGTDAGASADPTRLEAIAAIERPDTGDAAEDSYVYGYRLWNAGLYPEAQAQLKKTFETYAEHRRASFAHNLYGRALLDGGKPREAALALHKNYQSRPRGERAPDSLYYLGKALTEMKENEKACLAFGELTAAYPDTAAGRLSDELAEGRAKAGCD